MEVLFIIICIVLGAQGMGSKTMKQQDSEMMSMMSEYLDMDSYADEMGEIRELARDEWEIGVQRDLCPWAECRYCTCNGERATCTETTPTNYRGPTPCKDKSLSRQPGQCFFHGGKSQLDCRNKKHNNDYVICFPTTSTDNIQQICLSYVADCENLIDFCNCSRACAMSRPPPVTQVPPGPVTNRRAATDRKTAPPLPTNPTTTPTVKVQTISENDALKPTTRMETRQGSFGSTSDTNVSKTTGIQEGTNATISPDIQDHGFNSILSSMGILALSFGGLLLVCLVFIITVVCTCTCKSHRAAAVHDDNLKYEEPHAYYYVDVDTNGVVSTGVHQRLKPILTNPVYDSHVNNEDTMNIRNEKGTSGIYSEADSTGFAVISTEHADQNQYAECRPLTQAAPTTPCDAVAYMELDSDQGGTATELQVEPYTKLQNTAVYMDLQFGGESLSSEGNDESESESSTEPDGTDASTTSGSRGSMSSADSGVDEEHKADYITSDFEGDNAQYFEAKTLPLPHRAQSSDSLTSGDQKDTTEVVRKNSSEKTPKIIEDNPLKKCNAYQKLRCQTKGRSFSIDSACSDNTYNALTSTGTLTLAEEDGKYSTLVREAQEGKRRETESSDSDNTYSELSRDNS